MPQRPPPPNATNANSCLVFGRTAPSQCPPGAPVVVVDDRGLAGGADGVVGHDLVLVEDKHPAIGDLHLDPVADKAVRSRIPT